MTEPYLPKWATADEAGNWLKAATGQDWPLPRLLTSGVAMSIWIDCADDQEQHIVDHVFLGRREGFRAPVAFASDLERLAFVRDSGTLSITQRRDGTPLRVPVPLRFPASELLFSAADVRKIPPALEQGKLSGERRYLSLQIGDVTMTAEDPYVAQWLELNGGLEALASAKIELVEFAAPMEPAAAPAPTINPAPPADDWTPLARRYADDAWTNRPKGTNPSKGTIGERVAKRFMDEGRRQLSGATVTRHALKDWKKPTK